MKLLGTQIMLRDERRDSDNDDFFRWMNLEEWQYYDEPDKPFQRISQQEFDKRLEERRDQPTKVSTSSHTWQVDTNDGQHIGWVNYYHLDEKEKLAYVGICLPEEEMWGRGFGTEAVALLVDHLFSEMELREIRAATWTGNKRMTCCAEKCGFREIIRKLHRTDYSTRGEPLQRIEFSISRTEWLDQEGKSSDSS